MLDTRSLGCAKCAHSFGRQSKSLTQFYYSSSSSTVRLAWRPQRGPATACAQACATEPRSSWLRTWTTRWCVLVRVGVVRGWPWQRRREGPLWLWRGGHGAFGSTERPLESRCAAPSSPHSAPCHSIWGGRGAQPAAPLRTQAVMHRNLGAAQFRVANHTCACYGSCRMVVL